MVTEAVSTILLTCPLPSSNYSVTGLSRFGGPGSRTSKLAAVTPERKVGPRNWTTALALLAAAPEPAGPSRAAALRACARAGGPEVQGGRVEAQIKNTSLDGCSLCDLCTAIPPPCRASVWWGGAGRSVVVCALPRPGNSKHMWRTYSCAQ